MPPILYVDVDDTLLRSAGTKQIPIPATIAFVRAQHAVGATLYCWSAGGPDYARHAATLCGIAHCFTAFLPKPTLLLDDQPPTNWPNCQLLYPNECINDLNVEGRGSGPSL